MNLWILSQDGKHFFQNPKLSVETMNGYGYIVDNSTQTILGKYESEERTIEVIKKIYNFLNLSSSYDGNYEELDLFVKSKIWESMLKIHKMPKE